MKFALRRLWLHRRLFAGIVAFLGIGFGVTTAIFSLVDVVLVRALPVDEPQQIVSLVARSRSGFDNTIHSYPLFARLRSGNATLAGFVARAPVLATTSDLPAGDRLRGELVSDNYFTLLSVRPAAGRVLTSGDEDRAPGEPIGVLSHGAWTRWFGRRADAIGRSLLINGRSVEIVGVAAEGFQGVEQGASTDVWLPVSLAPLFPGMDGWNDEGRSWLFVLGRLRPEVTTPQAADSLRSAATDFNQGRREDRQISLQVTPAYQGYAGVRFVYGRALQLLIAVAAFVLVLSLVNAVLLLLSALIGCTRALATSLALGATASRLYREFLYEGLIVGVVSGGCGAIVGFWVLRGIVGLLPAELSVFLLDAVSLWRVLGFAVIVSVASGVVLSTAVGALGVTRNVAAALSSRGELPGRGRLRHVLVSTQIAISLVLVMCGLLLATTLYNLRTLPVGFDAERLVLATVEGSANGRSELPAQLFHEQLLERVRRLPGVQAASVGRVSPLSGEMMARDVEVPGRTIAESVNHYWNRVSPGYFQTLLLDMKAGRDFRPEDAAGPVRVAIINERMAHQDWPGESALGKTFRFGRDVEVVGVVSDSKYLTLREAAPLIVYTPLWQGGPVDVATLHVRATAGRDAVLRTIRDVVRSVDPRVPVYGVRTMDAQIDALLVTERLTAVISGLLASLALLLALVGLYANVAYSIERRYKEIVIRQVLGASRGSLLRLFLTQNGRLVLAGAVAGMIAVVGINRLLSNLLFGVQWTSVPVLFTVALIFVAVTLVATIVPFRRAPKDAAFGVLQQE